MKFSKNFSKGCQKPLSIFKIWKERIFFSGLKRYLCQKSISFPLFCILLVLLLQDKGRCDINQKSDCSPFYCIDKIDCLKTDSILCTICSKSFKEFFFNIKNADKTCYILRKWMERFIQPSTSRGKILHCWWWLVVRDNRHCQIKIALRNAEKENTKCPHVLRSDWRELR